MKFYKSILDSWNFHFEAYAENETLAREHLKKGLNNHANDISCRMTGGMNMEVIFMLLKLKLVHPRLILVIVTII